ncbi:MAG: hypothetical protein GEU80_02065 [Dehalococcoidia bacterium]|nr:hypothetical protein [Dehalococcoidia bacterium]
MPRATFPLALLGSIAIASTIVTLVLTRDDAAAPAEAGAGTFLVWLDDERDLPEAEGIRYELVDGVEDLRLEMALATPVGVILDLATWEVAGSEPWSAGTPAFGQYMLAEVTTFVLGDGDIGPFEQNPNPSPAAANEFVLWVGTPEHPDERAVPFVLAFNRRHLGPAVVEYSDVVFTSMLREEVEARRHTYLVYTVDAIDLPVTLAVSFEPVADLDALALRILEPGIDGVVLDQGTMYHLPLDRIAEWQEAGTVFVALDAWHDELRAALASGQPPRELLRERALASEQPLTAQHARIPHFAVVYSTAGPHGGAVGRETAQPFTPLIFPAFLGLVADEVRLELGGT